MTNQEKKAVENLLAFLGWAKTFDAKNDFEKMQYVMYERLVKKLFMFDDGTCKGFSEETMRLFEDVDWRTVLYETT